MTRSETQSSGTSSLPAILTHPRPIPFANAVPIITNLMCYVIDHYGDDGLSVLLYRDRQHDNSYFIFGDWNGNKIDIEAVEGRPPHRLVPFASEFVRAHSLRFLELLSVIKLTQAQFYFSTVGDDLTLVDVQLSLNKWAGPGMVQEMFGRIIKTQTVKKIEVLDDRALDAIERGIGHYAGDLVLKPSRYRQYHDQATRTYYPLYVEIKR